MHIHFTWCAQSTATLPGMLEYILDLCKVIWKLLGGYRCWAAPVSMNVCPQDWHFWPYTIWPPGVLPTYLMSVMYPEGTINGVQAQILSQSVKYGLTPVQVWALFLMHIHFTWCAQPSKAFLIISRLNRSERLLVNTFLMIVCPQDWRFWPNHCRRWSPSYLLTYQMCSIDPYHTIIDNLLSILTSSG